MRIKDLNGRQRRVLTACRNGWFSSGEYRAHFAGHQRDFRADSPAWLYRDVDRWVAVHELRHADAPLLVKCVKAV